MTAAAQPPWKMRHKPPLAALRRDLDVDVAVIGAGIAGLTTAYLLARDRRRVAVLDAAGLGAGMTAATTGHLSSAIDARYFRIESAHGEAAARIVAASHTAAIDAIEEIVQREGIDCGLTRLPGYLFAATETDDAELERELGAAGRAGLQVSLRDVPAVGAGRCLEFPRQGQFEPLRYLAGLAVAFRRLGGRIYRVRAEQVAGGAQPTVSAGGRSVRSRAVVVATNAPFNDRLAVHLQQTSKMTYAIGLRARRGAVPPALYWDTAEPYHYVRVEPMRGLRGALPGWAQDELVIVGGNDHRAGSQPEEPPHRSLTAWARRHIPPARSVVFRWGGEIREALDGLAFIGRNPLDEENVYVVSGDCGMGLTHGTIAGLLLRELVAGRDHPWREVYDPRRIRAAAALGLLREGAESALRFADRILPATAERLAAIRRGAGAVVQRGAQKVAVFRDDHGRLHERSAVCPHLGCVVAWNAAEKSWDCPCHGSRFSSRGQVFAAPANRDLDPAG